MSHNSLTRQLDEQTAHLGSSEGSPRELMPGGIARIKVDRNKSQVVVRHPVGEPKKALDSLTMVGGKSQEVLSK